MIKGGSCTHHMASIADIMEYILTVIHINGMYKLRNQNPDKSNNFFTQNVFNEKLNITKNPFTWHLGDLCRAHLFDIFSISLNDDLYSR